MKVLKNQNQYQSFFCTSYTLIKNRDDSSLAALFVKRIGNGCDLNQIITTKLTPEQIVNSLHVDY